LFNDIHLRIFIKTLNDLIYKLSNYKGILLLIILNNLRTFIFKS